DNRRLRLHAAVARLSAAAVGDISEGGPKRNLGTEALSRAQPEVRIHLPPAESQSLARTHFRKSTSPAFRAGVCGWVGDRVGRDVQGVSISRQPAEISLSGQIPVPQCP